MNLVTSRNILNYKLEAVLDTPERGVAIRREMLAPKLPVDAALACLPYKDYDYSKVLAKRISVKRVVLFIYICELKLQLLHGLYLVYYCVFLPCR